MKIIKKKRPEFVPDRQLSSSLLLMQGDVVLFLTEPGQAPNRTGSFPVEVETREVVKRALATHAGAAFVRM